MNPIPPHHGRPHETLSAVELAELIRFHNQAYFVGNAPLIPDQVFDQLVERLRRLDPDAPILNEVGAGADEPLLGEAVDHEVPMVSLGKCYDARELLLWAREFGVSASAHGHAQQRFACRACNPLWGEPIVGVLRDDAVLEVHCADCELSAWTREARETIARGAAKIERLHWRPVSLVASPKVDGAACAIRYEDGRLVVAATRGNGRRGENITANVRRIPNVPGRLPADWVAAHGGKVEVRGEIYMPLTNFAAVADVFANPRNVAAGTLKSKEDGAVNPEQLCFFAYDLLGCPADTEQEKAHLLRVLGFTPAPVETCQVDAAEAIYQGHVARRGSLDYEVDGVVYKVDDSATQQRVGSTSHHPRWAIAFKFQGDSDQSALERVDFSLSRTGTITPVAIVAPVALSGATVTRATLHNLSNLRRLDLHVGDVLQLTRRGGVIPHVEGNLGGGDHAIAPPDSCPSCGEATVERQTARRVVGQDVVTETLHCSRPSACPAVQRERLLHFTAALEMDGFGDKIIDGLLARGLVKDAADLFRLDEGALLGLPRMGELLARRLLRQIEAARAVAPAALLVALGIDSLGRHAAELLATRWTLAQLLELEEERLTELHSLGAITAARIVAGLAEEAPLIRRLLAEITVQRRAETTGSAGPLAGELVVFTGALQHLNRRDAQQLVVRLGGRAGSSVTAQTTILVIGGDGLTAARPSSKLKKARALQAAGQPLVIQSESDFHARLP